jgi:hypothetical protein
MLVAFLRPSAFLRRVVGVDFFGMILSYRTFVTLISGVAPLKSIQPTDPL